MLGCEDSSVASASTFEKTCASFGRWGDDQASSPKEEERMKSLRKVKCHHELLEYHCLPNYLKHNEFILDYYRADWPLKQAILSIFSIHNETLNVWTHLVGFFVFLLLTMYAVTMVPLDANASPNLQMGANLREAHLQVNMSKYLRSSDSSSSSSSSSLPNLQLHQIVSRFSQANLTDDSHAPVISKAGEANEDDEMVVQRRRPEQPITRWPFLAFLCGAMFCLLSSSACHLLSCHSEHMSYVTLRLDYAGISALIVTSFYPMVYYTFMCEPFFRNLYLGFITVFGVATILVSLVPVFETPEFRLVRAMLFFCMGFSGLVPIAHKLIAFSDRPQALLTTGYEMVMGAFYGMGVVVYATRVPERWMPGKFDLVGHSHQLFHVLVIAGAYTHYLAGLVYLQWRDMEGCC